MPGFCLRNPERHSIKGRVKVKVSVKVSVRVKVKVKRRGLSKCNNVTMSHVTLRELLHSEKSGTSNFILLYILYIIYIII